MNRRFLLPAVGAAGVMLVGALALAGPMGSSFGIARSIFGLGGIRSSLGLAPPFAA